MAVDGTVEVDGKVVMVDEAVIRYGVWKGMIRGGNFLYDRITRHKNDTKIVG